MFAHQDIWRAIDKLAASRGLSVSGLARRAGLDPTTFNKSKRVTRDGKARWPSTESVSKVLQCVEAPISEFASFLDGSGGTPRRLPLIALGDVREGGGVNAKGLPSGASQDQFAWPHIEDPHGFAVEVTDAHLAPHYRSGDLIVVSPREQPRRGDRVLLKTRAGEVMAMQIARTAADRVELHAFDGGTPRTFETADLAWMHRIVWV
ncbi:MAG: helix-turn-helix transcriptional regulator, partial [Alphaproteobacteria bacterium]|nr:helix-turn-helix transcriptional regulator [Alphaproteobacteria bacterium]